MKCIHVVKHYYKKLQEVSTHLQYITRYKNAFLKLLIRNSVEWTKLIMECLISEEEELRGRKVA